MMAPMGLCGFCASPSVAGMYPDGVRPVPLCGHCAAAHTCCGALVEDGQACPSCGRSVAHWTPAGVQAIVSAVAVETGDAELRRALGRECWPEVAARLAVLADAGAYLAEMAYQGASWYADQLDPARD